MSAKQSTTVILDCDGVILDSNAMKSDAFAQTLHRYPEPIVAQFIEYQKKQFGRSRYKLLADFFSKHLQIEPENTEIEVLTAAFGAYCEKHYLTVDETTNASAALTTLANSFELFVVSGSSQTELRRVFATRGLAAHFAGIFGSPTTKPEHLRAIASAAGCSRMLFVGDSMIDLESAESANVEFVFMESYSTNRLPILQRCTEAGYPIIRDLGDLAPLLAR